MNRTKLKKKTGKSKIGLAISKIVKDHRKERGLTQNDIAKICKVSRGFIGQIESPSSKALYQLNHLNSLAKVFKVSPRDLVPEKPIMG